MNESQCIRLKEKEVELLKVFIEVCEKLKLKYYVLGGTLLGAVRHKGFIPWDDDIDVGMPREDYELFLKKAQELLPKNLFLQSFITDPEWPANFSKIRDSETTFIETSVKNRKINHGVYIDVFPLDWHVESKKEKAFYRKKSIYDIVIAKSFYLPNRKKSFRLKLANLATFAISIKTALKKRDKLFKSNKERTHLANYGGAWGKKEIVPCDWYGDGVELEFEGIKVRAPQQYDKWLTQVYGDYMQLPPEEKRVAHHFTEKIDLDKSYKEYIK